jgi:hypothetical protein
MRAPEPPFPSFGQVMSAYYLEHYPPRFPLYASPQRHNPQLHEAQDTFLVSTACQLLAPMLLTRVQYTVDYRDEPWDAPSFSWVS